MRIASSSGPSETRNASSSPSHPESSQSSVTWIFVPYRKGSCKAGFLGFLGRSFDRDTNKLLLTRRQSSAGYDHPQPRSIRRFDPGDGAPGPGDAPGLSRTKPVYMRPSHKPTSIGSSLTLFTIQRRRSRTSSVRSRAMFVPGRGRGVAARVGDAGGLPSPRPDGPESPGSGGGNGATPATVETAGDPGTIDSPGLRPRIIMMALLREVRPRRLPRDRDFSERGGSAGGTPRQRMPGIVPARPDRTGSRSGRTQRPRSHQTRRKPGGRRIHVRLTSAATGSQAERRHGVAEEEGYAGNRPGHVRGQPESRLRSSPRRLPQARPRDLGLARARARAIPADSGWSSFGSMDRQSPRRILLI